MKIGIVGAGAIGAWMATKLANAGHDVSVLARGETLKNIRAKGVRVRSGEDELQADVSASFMADDLGLQDLVIFAVKGQALAVAAASAKGLIGPNTAIMPAMNGVPWWFLEGAPGELSSSGLRSVDPDGSISDTLPVEQVVGCVVHASTFSIEPGYVNHVMGGGLILGAAHQGIASKLDSISEAMSSAGYDVTLSDNIRFDIWYKLWGNMTMNPLSAITGATCDLILADEGLRGFATAIMDEAAEIGGKIGCPITDSAEDRHAITAKLGAFKTSMLQDAEAGRPLEIDALLAAPQEIARKLEMPTPSLDHLLGVMRVFEKARHG